MNLFLVLNIKCTYLFTQTYFIKEIIIISIKTHSYIVYSIASPRRKISASKNTPAPACLSRNFIYIIIYDDKNKQSYFWRHVFGLFYYFFVSVVVRRTILNQVLSFVSYTMQNYTCEWKEQDSRMICDYVVHGSSCK